jgi:hypothetical protein
MCVPLVPPVAADGTFIFPEIFRERARGDEIGVSDADRTSRMDSASDVHCGKAWRVVQRPSDMVHEFIDLYYFRDTSL